MEKIEKKAEECLEVQHDYFVHNSDGLLYNWINLCTMQPFTLEDLPVDAVYRCRPGMPDLITWINNENTIQKSGQYLSAMSIAYSLTNEKKYLHIADRLVDAFIEILNLTEQLYGERGWLPKAFGWIPNCVYSNDMNTDQVDPVIQGLIDYCNIKDNLGKNKAVKIITDIVDMLIRWDYSINLSFTAGMGDRKSMWNSVQLHEQVPLLRWLWAAADLSGDQKYRQEYERVINSDSYTGNIKGLTRFQIAEFYKVNLSDPRCNLSAESFSVMDEFDAHNLPKDENAEDYVLIGGGWPTMIDSLCYLAHNDTKRHEYWKRQLMNWWEDEILPSYASEHHAGHLRIYYNPKNKKYHRVTQRVLNDVPKIRRNFLSWCRGTWLNLGDIWAINAVNIWSIVKDQKIKDFVMTHLAEAGQEDFVWIKDPYDELPPQVKYLEKCYYGPTTWLLAYWRAKEVGIL